MLLALIAKLRPWVVPLEFYSFIIAVYFYFLRIKFGLNDLIQITLVTTPQWCVTLIS